MINDKETFKTADYGLATWLVYRRVTLLGSVEMGDDPRKRFIFLASPDLNDFIEEWSASDEREVLTCKRFFRCINTVKHALRESERIGG